jgi:Uma2 family endonuclease
MRLELTAQGELIIMPPTGGETGNRNFELYLDLGNWNRQTRLGKAFDSSTGFQLPNGAKRSPDLSWIAREKWESLSGEQRKKFLPLCPDFAVELVSESDELDDTRKKMREYLDNGLRLGWLIVPKTQEVEIYRPGREVEYLQSSRTLSGEEVLPGLVVYLQPIWGL